MHRTVRRTAPLALTVLGGLALASVSNTASAADVQKRGGQIEGMIGGSGCIPGRAPCRQDGVLLQGGTRPSFGTGVALGYRPVKWFMFGGMYRYGMFNPDYRVDGDSGYRSAAQHTFAVMFRPILPIWRFDFGLNIAPGFGRQVFHLDHGRDRDLSQGFSFLTGPTVDVFLTRRFFLGAEVDFIFNTQRRVCQRRGDTTTCSNTPERNVAPTHQVLFGLHLGGTFG
ncbi:MAG: hypothetical protein IPH07_18195 [Deltaproteobacteria bacterium]|nr:hypothetical protein [Deltaproteobacteria bacterium]MBK8238751.1 hypothetical protein [Deltaproteobacteria bacterium]MBK8715632.1 hypothetical protein [Deltaproteobacteria bacterium]MBP7287234.1 hypothetical protein [Nannocystaceae bacterium]